MAIDAGVVPLLVFCDADRGRLNRRRLVVAGEIDVSSMAPCGNQNKSAMRQTVGVARENQNIDGVMALRVARRAKDYYRERLR